MRDYGKVHTTFWSSQTTRGLSEDGRALALYLLTCPHGTIAGAFRLPDGYASEDLQWAPERVKEGFAELFAKGFANRCETTKWVWIVKHFEWNPPENPNQRKGCLKIVGQVPDECSWKSEFMRVCGPHLGIEHDDDRNPCGTLPKPFLNQEQEQEQEKEKPPSLRSGGVGGATVQVSPPDQTNPPPSKAASPSAPPAESQGAPKKAPERAEAKRGTRLPAGWVLPKAWGEWALLEKPAWSADHVRQTAEAFRDHWLAKPGRDALKLDWEATWRNWVRKEPDIRGGARRGDVAAPRTDFAGVL